MRPAPARTWSRRPRLRSGCARCRGRRACRVRRSRRPTGPSRRSSAGGRRRWEPPATGRSSAYFGGAGDDVASVEASGRRSDAGELLDRLRRGRDCGHGDLRRCRRQRSVRRGPPVRRDDRGVACRERPGGDAELLRRRGDEAGPGGGGDGAHRRVERVHRVRPAGQLVPHQLRARVVEHDVDGIEPGVELFGRDDPHRGRDALPDLRSRDVDDDTIRRGDLDLEEVRGRQRGEGERVD